jgi:hypothetical protein
MASIQVTRRLQYQGLLARWFVFVDDVQIAKLRRGKPATLTTTQGRHTLMVGSKTRRTRSNALELDLTQSANVRLKCEVNPGFMRMAFFNGPLQNFRLAGSALRKELNIIDLSVQDADG